MSSPRVLSANPFKRHQGVDEPGIIGALWWNDAVEESSLVVRRRAAMAGLAVAVGGVLLLGGVTLLAAASEARRQRIGSGDTDRGGDDRYVATTREKRRSVEVQRDFGWNFGATTERVAFNALYTKEYKRAALATLETDMAPKGEAHRPLHQSTLYQSPEALPRLKLEDGETSRVRPLADVLKPLNTPTMESAENRARAILPWIAKLEPRVALVIDLDGPDSVAFAAGAADHFDPVSLFDNWPHPRGIVFAHLTLGAAIYHQPTFTKAKATRRPDAPPAFILDRARLTQYTDEATQFDNRWWAKVPPVTLLKAAGIGRVLYVVPFAVSLPELDDLSDAFLEWKAAGVDVRAISVDWHGSTYPETDAGRERLLAHYGWLPEGAAPPAAPDDLRPAAAAYVPAPRPAPPDGGAPSIGLAPVVLAAGTGLVLGSVLNRNGSWNRTYSGLGGG